jgi:outer membrane protein assembly factor BamE (lipoprotein component of BamABCDE complex)
MVRQVTYREMTLFSNNFKRNISAQAFVGLLIASSSVAGCKTVDVISPSETIQQGYVIDEQALAAVPVGSSREQVLLSLGTPSTVNNLDGSEVFYYISQTRKRAIAFQSAKLVDQRVMAVYFAADGTVSNIANYGLKDGKVFDFIKRVTPTGGKDITFLSQVLSGVGKGGVPKLPGT